MMTTEGNAKRVFHFSASLFPKNHAFAVQQIELGPVFPVFVPATGKKAISSNRKVLGHSFSRWGRTGWENAKPSPLKQEKKKKKNLKETLQFGTWLIDKPKLSQLISKSER